MTGDTEFARTKKSLLELADYLNNVSEACRVMGVSRQHFCDIRKAFEEGGIEALKEKSRRWPGRGVPARAPRCYDQQAKRRPRTSRLNVDEVRIAGDRHAEPQG
ncbi:MAG: helix-turn-helix domain-containing protein [Planctomycetes bacterium]|nr:helix-turn-helix domain-containing protein [Planctomycetota bacterium]